MTAWLAFQEKYGAEKAERLADKWLKRHASSYDEDAFDDVDLAALEKGLKPDPEIIALCDFYVRCDRKQRLQRLMTLLGDRTDVVGVAIVLSVHASLEPWQRMTSIDKQ
eukprot:scaffold699_cov69-Skeletonema_menzelii.AAC.1